MSTTSTYFGPAEAQAARSLIGGTAIGDTRNELLKQILVAMANKASGPSGVAWGAITGTLAAQTDLINALAAKLDLAGGTMTGALVNSANGAASTPPLLLSGTVFTGGSSTTTKPSMLIEPAGTTSNNWSTSGTMLGVNAPSGFNGKLLSMQINGAAAFEIQESSGGVIFGLPAQSLAIYNNSFYPASSNLSLGGGGLPSWTGLALTQLAAITFGSNARIQGTASDTIHISGLPTSNPGPGILWNNAGTPAIGT
jgi:hypothetical protein